MCAWRSGILLRAYIVKCHFERMTDAELILAIQTLQIERRRCWVRRGERRRRGAGDGRQCLDNRLRDLCIRIRFRCARGYNTDNGQDDRRMAFHAVDYTFFLKAVRVWFHDRKDIE